MYSHVRNGAWDASALTKLSAVLPRGPADAIAVARRQRAANERAYKVMIRFGSRAHLSRTAYSSC
jgi:hypothetical protein